MESRENLNRNLDRELYLSAIRAIIFTNDFIDQYLIHSGNKDFTDKPVEFVFNRDIFINEDAKIDNCVKSVGIISNKTILARHPWVTNVEHELTQIEEDKKEELKEMQTMAAFTTKQNTNGGASK